MLNVLKKNQFVSICIFNVQSDGKMVILTEIIKYRRILNDSHITLKSK